MMWPEYFANADTAQLQVYEENFINDVFNNIKNDFQLEFHYPQGGCQQRAHIMSLLFSKKLHVDHVKVWLFAPMVLILGDTRNLFIEDAKKFAPGDTIEWGYHVAPVVQVNLAGKTTTMVIDPSIDNNKPMLLQSWFESIGNSNISRYTFLLPDKYFFNCSYNTNNELTMLFDGTFMDYNEIDKNNLTLEKGLAMNDTAIKIYNDHVKPLLDKKTDEKKLNELKDIFGNATALDLLISQNISGQTLDTMHRYAMTHYSDIMKEARSIFSERLAYWTFAVNELI